MPLNSITPARMESVMVLSRDIENLTIEYTLPKMGCNQSSGTVDINTQSNLKSEQKMDLNSNNQKDMEPTNKPAAAEGTDESAVLTRFQGELITQLQSIATQPPVMPKKLDNADPRVMLIPSIFRCEETLEELKQNPLPSNSALVVTYLKSGTHWMWEIVKMMKKREAKSDNLPKETAHLEFFPPHLIKAINGRDIQSFATHFPLWTLPKSCYSDSKIIYVYRNPKDVCVSLYYHYMCMSEANPQGFPPITFDQYFEMFLGPSEANMMGNWFDHVADYWDNYRDNSQILCVQFEEMKKDPYKELCRINEHLGTEASEELLREIVQASSFDAMKKDKEASEKIMEIVFKGSMYRKGMVGDWKNHMNEEQISKIDKVIADWQSARPEPVPLIFEL